MKVTEQLPKWEANNKPLMANMYLEYYMNHPLFCVPFFAVVFISFSAFEISSCAFTVHLITQ